ncbi:MAG: hypothetical protein HY680_00965 [Chloroflexi bacterium]|nr:hypothetical protein [Chloroflexota bacterium]
MVDHSQETARLMGSLISSVQAFHQRFGLVGPSTQHELLSRLPLQEEEVRELRQAILSEPPEHVAAEAVDVLYVAIGTVLRLEAALAAQAIEEVIRKNDAKTWETHYINGAGKVAKRG